MLDLFGVNLKYIGRPDSATPAVGSTKVHEKQAKTLLMHVFPTLAAATQTVVDGKEALQEPATKPDVPTADPSEDSPASGAEKAQTRGKRSGASRRTTAQKR